MPQASSAPPAAADQSQPRTSLLRRVPVLLTLLVLVLIAWPVSRRWLAPPVPPRPAANADDRMLTSYYFARLKADPSDAEAYLDLGRIEEKRGFYNQASEHILIARALGLPDAKTAGPLGRCWMKLGRTERALSELETAAQLNPSSHDAALNLAQLLAETGQGDKASAILGFFLRHHPEYVDNPSPVHREAVERLMVAYVGLGEAEPAIRLAQQVVRLAPNEPNGFAVAGRCFMAQRRWADAALNLERAVTLAPDNANLHYLHGVALKHLPGKIEDALKEWQRAAEMGSLAAAFGELGAEYARRKDWRRAAIGYMRAASITETDADLYSVAGTMCAKNGQTDLAALCRARAAGLRGQYETALKDYSALVDTGNPKMRRFGIEGAIDCFRGMHKAKEFLAFILKHCSSGSADDEMRIADAYGELADNARRVEHLRKALALSPHLAGHIHHEIGIAAVNAGRRDEAERELDLAIQAEPENPRHHHTMVGILMDRRSVGGRLQRAIREAEKTVQLLPDSSEDYHLLGTAYMAANLVPKAIQAFQRSIDLQPGYGPAYLDLGKLYARIGDRVRSDETLQYYRKYQAFDLEKQTLTTRANANKKDAAAQVALGDFYARANDYAHAREQYRKARQLAPKDPSIRKKAERTEVILGMAPAAPAGSGPN